MDGNWQLWYQQKGNHRRHERPVDERRGIGKKLLESVQDCLFGLGHEELWLATTSDPSFRAYGFCLAQGWRATGEILDEDQEKIVLRRTQKFTPMAT